VSLGCVCTLCVGCITWCRLKIKIVKVQQENGNQTVRHQKFCLCGKFFGRAKFNLLHRPVQAFRFERLSAQRLRLFQLLE